MRDFGFLQVSAFDLSSCFSRSGTQCLVVCHALKGLEFGIFGVLIGKGCGGSQFSTKEG